MAYTGTTSYGSVEIVVEPDRLNNAAGNVLKYTNTMKNSLDSIRIYVSKTKGYWKGEAGNFHRKLYENQQDTVDEIIKKLEARINELQQIASNYIEGESRASSQAEALDANIIDL